VVYISLQELNAVQKIGKTSSQKQRRYSDDVRKCCAYPTAGDIIFCRQ